MAGQTGRSQSVACLEHREPPAVGRAGEIRAGHERIRGLLEGLPEEDVVRPGRFAWTGKSALTTYVGANTASHYRFAMKVVRPWQKGEMRPGPRP